MFTSDLCFLSELLMTISFAVSSWCSCTAPARGGGWTVACAASSSPSWSVCARPRKRLPPWRSQRLWRPTWETWSSCLRWLGPWLGCTMARHSTRLKSRWGSVGQVGKCHYLLASCFGNCEKHEFLSTDIWQVCFHFVPSSFWTQN